MSIPASTPVSVPRTGPESGSILFYILIAVVLFAALSYAVANIMRSGVADPRREVRTLTATDVIQYGDGLKRAIQGMRIRGVADNHISFETALLAGYAPHAHCAADSCRVFQPAGGGMSYMAPAQSWLDPLGTAPLVGEWFFPAGVCVEDAGTGGIGCETDTDDNEDLVAILPWLTRDICTEINIRLGITNPAGNPPLAAGAAWPAANTRFTGTFTESAIIARGGELAGCLRGAGVPPTNSYFYYKVLLAR